MLDRCANLSASNRENGKAQQTSSLSESLWSVKYVHVASGINLIVFSFCIYRRYRMIQISALRLLLYCIAA